MVTWNAEQDQRLLLLILSIHKVNNMQIAQAWKTKYGDDVSANAIRQHLDKLKKEVGGEGAGDGQTPKATPSKATSSKSNGTPRKPGAPKTPSKATPSKSNGTPRKPGAPKTPTGGKRKARAMSDEDDSEDEKAVNATTEKNLAPRSESARRSKTPRSYREPSEDDAADDEGEATVKQEGGYGGSIFDQHMTFEGVAGNGNGDDHDAMSDISSFQP